MDSSRHYIYKLSEFVTPPLHVYQLDNKIKAVSLKYIKVLKMLHFYLKIES